ncbi:Fur family transcriptional regulator [Desulfotignum balticum]|jgi:Fur family ferric uptake transcriptional regulator|uniref:Fur family transcriptional regulator n=1 Tax=Desulfotignum balticum TaxID=115781 RepID=UPI00040ED529|nr:transcriptional repressor [Desulfotignum balticum]
MKRQTAQRRAIVQVFKQQDRLLAISEILDYGSRIVPSLNQATVYRNLKQLLEAGWLKQINYPSLGTRYERAHKIHHHHFHCKACNRVMDLPGCALKQEQIVPDGFVVQSHDVFLSGLCDRCAGR